MSSKETFDIHNVNVVIPAVTANTIGYKSRNVMNQNFVMRHYHVETLHRVMKGLMLKGATLATGKTVNSTAGALCWILEQVEKVAPAVESPTAIEPAKVIAPSAEKISRGEKIENENSKNENSKISDLEI